MTWRLDPDEWVLEGLIREFIRRHGIDTGSRRGQARVRGVMAFIEAIGTGNSGVLAPHLDALEDGDEEAIVALIEDWVGSLQRMVNERRPASSRCRVVVRK
jgi:hypothetical protein